MHRHLAVLAAALLLAACATPPPPAGAPREAVLQQWGPPTGRYTLPAGGERLEYATGPYGRTTWMVDLDAAGRVTQARQVLNEAEFMRMQTAQATPASQGGGLRRHGLLRWLGRPGEVRSGGREGGQVWSYRYPTNDCLWFQISVFNDGSLGTSGYFADPMCDHPGDAHR